MLPGPNLLLEVTVPSLLLFPPCIDATVMLCDPEQYTLDIGRDGPVLLIPVGH